MPSSAASSTRFCNHRRHGSADQRGAGGTPRSGPLQALHDPAPHHPVLIAVVEEVQLLGEMGDALAVVRLGVGVGEVGAPIAALRAVGVEHALEVTGDV